MEILIFVVVLIMPTFVLNVLYKRMNHYRNTIYQLQKYIDGVPDELEIVNTGSSYAMYAFDYTDAGIKGFNFGLQPQSLSYDYRILKQYSNKMKNGCIVLLTLPNFVFGFLDYKNDQMNTKYYYFLDFKNILGYNRIKQLVRVELPLISKPRNILRIFRDVPKQEYFSQDRNYASKEQVYAYAMARVKGWEHQFDFMIQEDTKLSKEMLEIFEKTTDLLKEIIEYCLNKNFQPVILVPPVSAVLNNLLPLALIKQVLYNNISKANTRGIPVLDYLYDIRFQDETLYINADMLNKTGREKFTSVVIEDLKQLGVVNK